MADVTVDNNDLTDYDVSMGSGNVDADKTQRITIATNDTNLAAINSAVNGTLTVDGSGSTQPISGTVTANLSAVDNAVLDNIDAQTAAIQAAVEVLDNAISGTEMQVDVVSSALPSGAATAANQSTANSTLAAIQTAVEILDNAISGSEMQVDVVSSALPSGAATSANQTTANSTLAAIQTAVEILDNAISGTEMQVDVVSSALPTGAATSANQTTGNASLSTIAGDTTSIDGKMTACNTNSVTIVATERPNGYTSFASGRKTVTTAGTAEQLASSTGCTMVLVTALPDNDNTIWIGDSGVEDGEGRPLFPAQSETFYVDNLASLWIDSIVDADGVSYVYYTNA